MSPAVDRQAAAIDRLRAMVEDSPDPERLSAWVGFLDRETAHIRARWAENDAVREEESQELLAAVAEWLAADQAAVLRPGEDAHAPAERQALAEERLRAVYHRIALANARSDGGDIGIQKGIHLMPPLDDPDAESLTE